jgi:hypothetical protein
MIIVTILFIPLKAKQREDATRTGAGTPHQYMDKYLNKVEFDWDDGSRICS